MLDLVNKDFTSMESVKEVLDKWETRGGAAYGVDGESQHAGDASADGGVVTHTSVRASFLTQLSILTRRTTVVAAREPLAYGARCAANFSATMFFAIIYLKTRERNQSQVLSRTFFLLFVVGIPMQFILVSVYLYYYQWLALKKEVKDGMYHPAAAALASWVVQLPMMFVLAICSLLPVFIIGDLHWPNLPMAWLIYALCFWAFEGMAQQLAIAPNVVIGLFNFLNLYFAAFLFCGMFVDIDDVIWPLRALCYFFPLQWAMQSYMYAMFHDMPESSGAKACAPGSTPADGGGQICSANGFYCPPTADDPAGAICFGRTGDEILNSLSKQFTIYGDNGHYARNIPLIIAFGALFRVVYLGMAWYLTKVAGGEEPAEPAEASSSVPQAVVTIAPPAAETEMTPVPPPVADAEGGAASPTGKKLEGMAKSFKSNTYTFSNIGYVITPKAGLLKKPGEPKAVLQGTSAQVSAGQVVAIIGPSGAGKTILLDTLTFAKGPGAPFGKIMINSTTLAAADFTDYCVYMPREDNLWPALTPRQHLEIAYKLFQPKLSDEGRAAAIADLLEATGMTSAQHTKAGGLLFQGLSGGQRRRLSLALALVKEPQVIILDEPTSGLDSAAAAAIVKLLGSLAKSCSACILCTIHQPSATVFAGFDQVLCLSEGRTAYCGMRDEMVAHFASIGSPLAADANPAEAVLDLVSKDISSAEAVTAVLDKWTPRALTAAGGSAVRPAEKGGGVLAPVLVVLKRTATLALIDPMQFTARLVICPFLVSFFGLVYKESANNVQKQVPFRLFYLWWILAIPPCLNIITIIGGTLDTRNVVHEIRSGMYKPLTYVLSTGLVQIPMLLVLGFVICVFCFLIGGWPFDNYASFCLQYSANLLVFESLAQLLAVAFRNPIVGMLIFLMYWSSCIMFCGLVFRGTDVIWPIRSFYYALPLRWLFNGVGYDIYTPATFDGAELCTPGAVITGGTGVCPSTGFFCPGESGTLGCYGRTGPQVREALRRSSVPVHPMQACSCASSHVHVHGPRMCVRACRCSRRSTSRTSRSTRRTSG